MTPADIDAIALRARAEAEAVALRAKAEVDAVALRAVAEAEVAAARARAEIEVHALRIGAEADRDEAARLLAETRHQVEQMLVEAQAHIDAQAAAGEAASVVAAAPPIGAPLATTQRSRADQETLDRLQATRLHLHDAIDRLTEMSEPVLDLTDGPSGAAISTAATSTAAAGRLADAPAYDDRPVGTVEAPDLLVEAPADPPRTGGGTDASDPVDAFVLAAIERASTSGVGVAEPDLWGGDHPSTRRRELRDGRDLL